jgi:hypothetical protein
MTELQQVLDSITDLKTELKSEFKSELKDTENRLDKKIEEYKNDVKLFNTKFDYYQQATQWVIVLAFTLILAATAITIFSSVFAFR